MISDFFQGVKKILSTFFIGSQACLSCHSEAESQFHKSIHWTWLADPADKDKQFGNA